ncbi:hypothetical protein BT96DRAFT_923181 [Gymnopus androsaceus JB14]|uniref:Uncharacterized protein n=1 Tax=Gymnopus androsaceus JB14 TaxID=1447944 RepID=A0A6A4HBC1_9AGAR|nr:hypothetical protein BT96DRAFT_923181 [Gymnopus androsaceus JB14]
MTRNSFALLFVPENPQLGIQNAYIVQVIVRSIGLDSNRSPSVDDRATFFCYADEISSAVESVVLGHLAYPGIPSNLVLKGEKYILRASRKEWNPGKDYWFKWGEQVVSAAPEKWVFEMVPMFEELANVEHRYTT